MAGDRQYVLILNTSGQVLKSLLWTRSDARTWQRATFDLAAYRGLTIRLAFGTYNDGTSGTTALYSDDATITVCWPAPPPPLADADRHTHRTARSNAPICRDLAQLRAAPPPSPTPTPTATPPDPRGARHPAGPLAAFAGCGAG